MRIITWGQGQARDGGAGLRAGGAGTWTPVWPPQAAVRTTLFFIPSQAVHMQRTLCSGLPLCWSIVTPLFYDKERGWGAGVSNLPQGVSDPKRTLLPPHCGAPWPLWRCLRVPVHRHATQRPTSHSNSPDTGCSAVLGG